MNMSLGGISGRIGRVFSRDLSSYMIGEGKADQENDSLAYIPNFKSAAKSRHWCIVMYPYLNSCPGQSPVIGAERVLTYTLKTTFAKGLPLADE